MLRKSFVILIAVVALISVGVLVAAAQSDDPQTPPFGHGIMGGMMMGRGHGMMGSGDMPMITVVAEALGLEQDALIEAFQSGQSLADIAEAQGVELQDVYDAMLSRAETHMADMVSGGYLTQEQADEHLAWMRDNMSEMPMFSGEGFGRMGMRHNMMGGGMMGHGHGMMGGGMMGGERGMGWHD